MIRKAREFARRDTEDEFQVLCGLWTPTRMPLTFGHVRRLLAVQNKTKRTSLQARAARLGWGVPELIAAIKSVQEPLSQGGRRPSLPRSSVAALVQITLHSEEWLRRYDKAWGRGESALFAQVAVSNAKERESAQASLKRTRKALKQLSQAALALEHRLGKIKVKDKAKAQATSTPKTSSKQAAPKSNSQLGKKSR